MTTSGPSRKKKQVNKKQNKGERKYQHVTCSNEQFCCYGNVYVMFYKELEQMKDVKIEAETNTFMHNPSHNCNQNRALSCILIKYVTIIQ